MGRLLNMAVSGALVLTPALAGCGGSDSASQSSSTPTSAGQTTSPATGTQTSPGTPNTTSSSEQAPKSSEPKENISKVTLLVSSPVFNAGSLIPARYTCDGSDTSPPLRWSAIPPGTAELALFIINLNSTGGKVQIYWAVAGIHPALKGISAGKLPSGAIVGRNSLGQSRYTICPAQSAGLQHYVVALFALQHSVAAAPGFSADALYQTVSEAAEYKGLTGFSYQRH